MINLHTQLGTSTPLFTRMRYGASFAIVAKRHSRFSRAGADDPFGSVMTYVATVVDM